MKKTIILHDTFLYKWWWERLVIMMAKILWADIASWFFSSWSFDLRKEWFTWKMISLSSEIFKKWFRHLKLKYAFLFKTKFLSDYEVVIFSGDSISAVRNCKKSQKKIYYCHTPPRYLYDLHDLYLQKVPFWLKTIFKIFCYIFKKMYEKDIKKMDLILTNSKNTQKRIKNFLWIDSIVLYPPVDMKLFKFLGQKDYYLSFARLADAKRVDMIVKAFLKMPNKNLVVIYWKNDPAKEKIFDLARDAKNIKFVISPQNTLFYEYIWNSIATIYIPIDEDFGMSPVESMASWKPVLWVDEWWLKESIIDKKTWLLLKPDFKIEDIISWVEYLSKEKCLEMKDDCIKRASDFSIVNFEKQLTKLIFD